MLVEVVSAYSISVVRGLCFNVAVSVIYYCTDSGINVDISMLYDDGFITGWGYSGVYTRAVTVGRGRSAMVSSVSLDFWRLFRAVGFG